MNALSLCTGDPCRSILAEAVATAIVLFGLQSGSALAMVVGVLIEVPVMLAAVGVVRTA